MAYEWRISDWSADVCSSDLADETPTQDPCRARRLCAAQADGGAGVRDHQIGDGVSPVFAARVGACQPRMDAGVPGVEFQTHGRAALKIRPDGLKKGEKRSPERKIAPKPHFLHQRGASLFSEAPRRHHFGIKHDRLLDQTTGASRSEEHTSELQS